MSEASSRGSGDVIRDLVEACLSRVDEEGPAAVDAFCAAHPEHAAAIRQRMEILLQMGLFEAEGDLARTPEALGDFELRESIGGGGMGIVYRARQVSLDREVALKLIRPEQLFFGGARERFRREVEVVARLRHPGIVPVYAVGEEEGIPFFAMERVTGCTLAEALSDLATTGSPLSGAALAAVVADRAGCPASDGEGEEAWIYRGSWADVCFRIASHVADALEHAHKSGVLHRDVKPSNVMLTPDGRVMLLDFGVSSIEGSERLTRSGGQVGTLAYMSPEQISGDADRIDARSDVYSLGATLYELLTHRPPYRATTTPELARIITSGGPEPVRHVRGDVSWEAEVVCQTAFDPDPARRYATAADFRADLVRVLERRPIAARTPGWALRLRRWVQRHPTASVALLLGFLLVVIGPLLFAVRERRARREVNAALGRSEANFSRAFAAIELLSQAGDRRLRGLAGAEPVRRELLSAAVEFYESFLAERSDDPLVRWEVAGAQRRLGRLRAWLGDEPGAAQALGEAIRLLDALIADRPGENEYRLELARALLGRARALGDSRPADAEADLRRALGVVRQTPAEGRRVVEADVLDELGDILRETNRMDEAEGRLRESLAVRRELPDAPLQRRASALTLVEIGRILIGRRRLDEAEQCYLDAASVLEELVAVASPDQLLAHDLILTYERLGRLCNAQRDWAGAEGWYRKSSERAHELSRALPGVPLIMSSEAAAWQNLSFALDVLGRRDEAEDCRKRARAVVEDLVERYPDSPGYRLLLGNILSAAANAARRAGRFDEALAIAARAVASHETAVAANPDRPEWKRSVVRSRGMKAAVYVSRARASILEGDWEAAGEDLANARGSGTFGWLEPRVAAGIAATCATLAGRSREFDEDERGQMHDDYVTRGLWWLERAIDAGYDKLDDVKTVDVLEELRSDARFARLLEKMADAKER